MDALQDGAILPASLLGRLLAHAAANIARRQIVDTTQKLALAR